MSKKDEHAEASATFRAKIMSRMNCMLGAELEFSNKTGFPYLTLRQWVSRPIIPFLFAELIALWPETDMADMMSWGVQITPQVRRARVFSKQNQLAILRVPTPESVQDEYVGLLAAALITKGYQVCNPVDGVPMVLNPLVDTRRHRLIFEVLQGIALRKITEYEKRDRGRCGPLSGTTKLVFRIPHDGS